jgi:5-methylcytosine-specific restriction endonuclease McrA
MLFFMKLYNSPDGYLFNLHTSSSSEARRLWRHNIKESWNHQCAYCGSEENLTIDHIVPQCKGGADFTKNVVCCCRSCNQSKGHDHWKLWYVQQHFYSEENFKKIEEWMKPNPPINLYAYSKRRNNLS